MKQILSTKKLRPNQRDLLLGSGFTLVDYDAINITPLDFEVPSHIENAIFTSQNSVNSLFSVTIAATKLDCCYCVGEKTRDLLIQKGQKVVEMAKNSKELAHILAESYKNETFFYFCGSQRREELPTLLKNAEMNVFELKTYQTELKRHKFHQKWDGILFFSPSGVLSYNLENSPVKGNLHSTFAICIGETTAMEAKKYFSNVTVANATRIESVIAKAVKTLQH